MSDQPKHFVALAVSGQTSPDTIDDFIDRWHENPEGLPLHAYLGFERDEYAMWLRDPDALPAILAACQARLRAEAVN